VSEVVLDGKADAVSVASILHYGYARQMQYGPKDFETEGNVEFLKKKDLFGRVTPTTIPELKRQLIASGIECRPPEAA